MRICVVGTGYVGLVSGACFAEIGHDCICVDLDVSKVERINRGEAPIHEAGLADLLARHAGARLRATTDLAAAVRDSDLTFIAVGTPFDGQRIDLSQVIQAARAIGAALRDKRDYHAVIVKSTVVPGTTDDVVRPELEHASRKRAGVDFGVGMNPEFLTEGVAVRDFMQPDRLVLGGIDERTIRLQRAVYAPFAATPVLETNNKTAEMIKYASNAVLATLISYSNEIANLCSALGGVDVADVMRGVHLARYFTTRLPDGARIPAGITSFLWAGCGYGGSCLPKDTQALAAHGAAHGAPMPLLEAVIETNRRQPARMIALLQRHFPCLAGLRISVLGVAFKEDTDDVRDSPALPIVRALLQHGARVTAYDPVARVNGQRLLPPEVTWVEELEQALAADAVLLLTRWRQFERLPALLAARADPPLVVDGRRMLAPASVPRYDGIGR
ncbi:MAG: UDP-glucose/GDP-mannose dehydrogenase family protein [Sutterellaceae bacterium]|nr:UDP-glucose/GDP-mannose dehydrogenase family protein [Burkholderiaceae bacterium]MCX7901115.1 UDP-glucose/GDP-mannose dehydrogenase family protein [Burkholderiaceae bacterium]MDW8429573.1 UDP-glucose/GDP-mannose dehydrogenase family protein [Sutterellaceae bacterium]